MERDHCEQNVNIYSPSRALSFRSIKVINVLIHVIQVHYLDKKTKKHFRVCPRPSLWPKSVNILTDIGRIDGLGRFLLSP